MRLINTKSSKKSTLTCLMLGLSLFTPIFAQAYTGVTIVMTTQTPANLEFVDQFNLEIAKNKQANLRVNVVNLGDENNLVVAENSELVIALGDNALEAASKLNRSTPVLGVFTPLPAFSSIMEKNGRELGNFGAIMLDQPYARQISLIKQVLPKAQKIGVLQSATSLKSSVDVREEAQKQGLNLIEQTVNQKADLIPQLTDLLDTVDTILAMPDPVIYSRETAQPILTTGYRYQKPIFGYSKSYVTAGALGAVYSTSKQVAKQAAEIAIESRFSATELPPPQIPKYFSIMLNYQVARSLNIPLLDEEEVLKNMLESDPTEVK